MIAKRIGIVTVLYKSDDVLPDFIESLSKQIAINYTLYIIDNSPTDSGCLISAKLTQNHGIDATIIFNNENVGVAKGNNQGIELALKDGCDFILLANNDTEFSPNTISLLLESLVKSGERVATPKIMFHNDPRLIWYCGGHINSWTMRVTHDDYLQVDCGQYDHLKYVGYAPTCFMIFDSNVFREIGLMDEDYFVYYDDVDFVWRMKQKGISISFAPKSVVHHKVSTSTGGERTPFSVFYLSRNRIYFLRKHFKKFHLLLTLSFVLSSRLVRLGMLPRELSTAGLRGIKEGMQMKIGSPSK